MKAAITSAFFTLIANFASADQSITLNPGQCVQVNGQQLCWTYRPSHWDHPDLPPQPCDYNKSCPVTYIVPDYNPQTLPNPALSKPADNNVLRVCRAESSNGNKVFKLVQINVKPEGGKTETVLNEYGDDERRCEDDAVRYQTNVTYQGAPVIIDTYRTPGACNKIQRTTVRSKKFKDLFK